MKKTLFLAFVLFAGCYQLYAQPYAPCNPNATETSKKVLSYIYSIEGKQMLSGQMGEKWNTNRTFNIVFEKTGKYPAIYGIDFLFGNDNRQKATTECINKWKAGSLIQCSWHAVQPWKPDNESTGWNDMHAGMAAASDIDLMLTSGTAYNLEWIKRLDNIAGYLKQMQDAGVTVLWRPFHEMNYSWFWWGRAARFKELWTQMYDRFVVHHGLNNLLWVFCPNYDYNPASATRWEDMYPGDEYVDILALDIYINYKHAWNKSQFDRLKTTGKGRPVAVGENGEFPDPAAMFSQGQNWVWWMTWNGFETQYANTNEYYTRIYAQPQTITQDEVALVEIVSVESVSINPVSGSVNTGSTLQLTANILPAEATNKTVQWSSSNNNIATVSSTGLVSGVAQGEVVITAKTVDGNKTATSQITVSFVHIPVSGVTINPTSYTVNAGGSLQLSATVSPANATNKNVSWSSDNTAVATVNSSGLVNAVALGNANVIVTTDEGGKTASCAITVTNLLTVNNNITGTETSQFLYSGTWNLATGTTGKYLGDDHWSSTTDSYYTFKFSGTNAQLYATKNSHHGIGAVSIDGGAESDVDFYAPSVLFQQMVFATPTLNNGIHTIKMRVTGRRNASSTGYVITADKAEVSSVNTGIDIKSDMNWNLLVFPNPTKSIANVFFENERNSIVRIYNPAGIEVFSKVFTGRIDERLNVSIFGKGMFILHVQTEGCDLKHKLIVF